MVHIYTRIVQLHIYPFTFLFMATLNMVARILVLVGGLNWGLVGWFDKNLVEIVLGGVAGAPMVVYILVGLAALYETYNWCMSCTAKK